MCVIEIFVSHKTRHAPAIILLLTLTHIQNRCETFSLNLPCSCLNGFS